MFKTKTLDQILYQDRHYPGGADIEVEDKDVNKLILLGAISENGIRDKIKKTKVEINVIKNPIKVEEKVPQEIIFREDKIEIEPEKKLTWETDLQGSSEELKQVKLNPKVIKKIYKENKRIKRKYNKRGSNYDDRKSFR